MNVTLKQLNAFLAVADDGSFTRAAERLHVAQPALSQHVRELEAELGLKLLHRTTRRVELTEGGKEFYWSATKVVQDLQLAVQNANDIANNKRGRLTVAAVPFLAAVILPAVLAEFQQNFPGVQIALTEARADQILEAVRLGQADCGVGTFPATEQDLSRLVLARDSLLIFCRKDHPFSRKAGVAWADLKDLPLITLTRDSSIRILTEIGFESAEIPLRPIFEVTQITTVLSLVEAGLGIAILPTYALAGVRDMDLCARPLVEPVVAREIVMVMAAERAIAPAALKFSEVLRRHANRLAPARVP